MTTATSQQTIAQALQALDENNPNATDGKWLESLTIAAAPHIREWDVSDAYSWAGWPEREERLGLGPQDIGIDVVAKRRADGDYIAIQCKARQLDASGKGADIARNEIANFAAVSSVEKSFWAERWLVTNGANEIGQIAKPLIDDPELPIKVVNIHADLIAQAAAAAQDDPVPQDAADPPRQTRQQMQDEAVSESVRLLREHAQSDSGGLPKGQARGRLILPCGTGKTRISLRIVETLTPPGELSIALCPSIALVAQIRREYLQHAQAPIRALAVCSDQTAGYDPKKENSRDTGRDPWVDNSNVSASEVKGMVTTDADEIAEWMRQGQGGERASVIFGTYQSGSRIAEALKQAGITARVLIADEAHRTAGLRRKRSRAKGGVLSDTERRIRDFTLCHDNAAFPATYRVYQTATPRIYDTTKASAGKSEDYVVRTMDDETVFGVELYRKSYREAVQNGWLSDYRIIALGINDHDAYQAANTLAANTQSKGRRALTSTDFLRGLAFTLAIGGATRGEEQGSAPINSVIAFMNTVDKSKNMAADLQTGVVREWLAKWMAENRQGIPAADFTLRHLDASNNVASRENAKRQLAEANADKPHGIINVGIFGEGTDSPSLSAVAFLEPRKSPIDVIQAVGRAMRIAPDKQIGYIICPIVIPPTVDPERWLSTSNMDEGWRELGQILLALRAHDQRIEDNLADLLDLYIPPEPEYERVIVGIAQGESRRIDYREHTGKPGEVELAIERVLNNESGVLQEFAPINPLPPQPETDRIIAETQQTSYPAASDAPTSDDAPTDAANPGDFTYDSADVAPADADAAQPPPIEFTRIVTGKKNPDGSNEIRANSVARQRPAPNDGLRGAVDIAKSKTKARNMINKGEGVRVNPKARRTKDEVANESAKQAMLKINWDEYGNAITLNLLAKSGLTGNRVIRDLNILETSVNEAAHHLRADDLQPALDKHFQLDNLDSAKRGKQADGCVTAALLMMNAAMLHQRIANGQWLSNITDLAALKNSPNIARAILRQWHRIISHDFKPVLQPAVEVIEAIEDTGKLAGLERALRHLAAEAERIAETYADMGADHAGPLFNRVMGNQASDGAFFTRPVAASIAARLTLDACGAQDWTSPDVWRAHKTIDLACGSGTLLAAMLADMKRRAKAQGASAAKLASLQKIGVEDAIKGFDINPVSLQLAASQLTADNSDIRYSQMGLYQMPYGPRQDGMGTVAAGTLELLGQSRIARAAGAMHLGDDKIGSQSVWNPQDNAELEDAVTAAKDARVVIMNPPFTNRVRMGEKFTRETQRALRNRADVLEQTLIRNDAELRDFVDKNSIAPLFVALGDKCARETDGVLTLVHPTIALSGPSGLEERRILAQRWHIHTILTSHQSGNINLSQNTAINESIVVAARHNGATPPTRIINLDRFPMDDDEASDLHACLAQCEVGAIDNGWGEVSYWDAERIKAGDWTAAIWRSPELAQAAARFSDDVSLQTTADSGLSPAATGRSLRGSFERADYGLPGAFPILKSKGNDAQISIQSQPDEHWIPKKRDERVREANGGRYPEADKMLRKAAYLLITAGQDNSSGRLTAVAGDEKYVGNGWMPIVGLSPTQAKALAVFINSTPGRLQLMRNAGKKLEFPTYSVKEAANIRIPDLSDAVVVSRLAACWERTKAMPVPQFRAGECAVRRIWDESVASALGWDFFELERLRLLLHQEPHVRGLGYAQYADAAELPPAGDPSLIPHLSAEQAQAAYALAREIWALKESAPPNALNDDAYLAATHELYERIDALLGETYGLSDDQVTDVERALRLIHATDEEEDAAIGRVLAEMRDEDPSERGTLEDLRRIFREMDEKADADRD